MKFSKLINPASGSPTGSIKDIYKANPNKWKAGIATAATMGMAAPLLVQGAQKDNALQAGAEQVATLAQQKVEQKSTETAKYQAMVDATYGSQAKKKGAGRPGSGLYAGLSGGASGLYNV